MTDAAGRRAQIGLFGDLITAERTPDLSAQFGYGLNTNDVVVWTHWTPAAPAGFVDNEILKTSAGGEGRLRIDGSTFQIGRLRGTIAAGNTITGMESGASTTIAAIAGVGAAVDSASLLIVNTGTVAGEGARTESTDRVRYRAGQDGYAIFTALWQDGSAGGSKLIAGLLDTDNGFGVGYLDSTDLVVLRRRGTVDTITARVAWDDPLDGTGPSGETLDPTKLNVFSIRYGYLGGAPPTFWWMTPGGVWIQFYQFETAGVLTTTHIQVSSLPVSFIAVNTSGVVNERITCGSYTGGTVGRMKPITKITRFLFSGSGISTEEAIHSVRVKAMVNGLRNVIGARLFGGPVSADANTSVTVRGYRNADLVGAVWTDLDADHSALEEDFTATAFSGGEVLFEVVLAKGGDTLQVDVSQILELIQPGESMTITGQSTAAATIDGALAMEELT